MAKQTTLDRCGVVLLDRGRGRTVPGPQPQRGPPIATDHGFEATRSQQGGQTRVRGQNALRIAHWNAEGVQRKKVDLQRFLRENTIDVCCIQETHLKDTHRFFIRGYEIFRQDRQNRPKGGLITLVKNNIPAAETQNSGQADLDTEFLGVKLVMPDTMLTVLNVYSSGNPIQLDSILVDPHSWIITGDFNSHSPSWGYQDLNKKGEDLENWAISNQLILINRPKDPPTCYSRAWRTTSTPDLAFATDDIHSIAQRDVSDQLGGSDHRPVIITVQRLFEVHSTRLKASWNYKKANWDLFKQEVDKRTSALTLDHHDINANAKNFNQAVLTAAQTAIPRGKRRNYRPYWSPELDALQKTVNEARDTLESSPTDENVAAHNRAQAAYTREKLRATRESWHEKTASLNSETDMHGLWKLAKNLNDDNPSRGKTVIEQNNQLKTEKVAANTFAELYREESTIHMSRQRTKQVREETTELLTSDPKGTDDSCMHELFSMKELKHAIRKLKSKKAPGPDGVTGDMLKHLGPATRKVLLQIFNQSWTTGVVPPIWKEAEIIPIPKKGKDKKDPHSYRPISLLSSAGKLLERMVNRRLTFLLEARNLLSPTQTGYRKFRNTEDQLAFLVQDIENAFQEKKKTLAVFFDLSRAFDKVWKEGLILKLLRAGIRDSMYMWIYHYLFGRTARVKLDGFHSRKVKLREGVPQGGVLSPILFLVYINDITDNITKHVSNSLHADDLAVWTSSEYTSTASYRLQEVVTNISTWTDDWGLVLNNTKTTSTLFSLSTANQQVKLKLQGQALPQTDTPTFLGIKLDTRLTWKPQIEEMERRGIRKLALLKKLAGTTWGADSSLLARVYTGAVRPNMEYASASWGTASKTNKSRLDKVQNMGLRLILGAMRSTPIRDMEKTANVEPLERRRDLKVLMQGEKLRRLPSHHLHHRLEQPTKNRLKRQSLNHQYKALRAEHRDVLPPDKESCTNLALPDWRLDQEMEATISLTVPGIISKDQQPATLKTLTLAMIYDIYPSSSWTHVYTDGSAEEATHNGGSGIYVRYPDGERSSLAVPGGKLCSNFRAEVLAIKTAADFLASCERPLGSISIFSDSMSTLQALDSPDPDPLTQSLKASLSTLTRKAQTTLQWVPAHVGIPGNERADRLAKEGSQLPQPTIPATYEETKTLLRSRFRRGWVAMNGGYQAHQDSIRMLERRQQTTIYRLRTGHCSLRAHLKRIGVAATSLCECGLADQTPSHVLQDCPLHDDRRQRIWPGGGDLYSKLWGTAAQLHVTCQFMASLGPQPSA